MSELLRPLDPALVDLLDTARNAPWLRKARGLRQFVIHHGGLLQVVNVDIGGSRPGHTYSIRRDEYFDQDDTIERPDSLSGGKIDRAKLVLELTSYFDLICALVDRVRSHCFDDAPAFQSPSQPRWIAVRRRA